MAEFCKKCFKEKIAVPSDNITDDMIIMSEEDDFCEGCGEIKPVVIEVKETSYLDNALEAAKKFNEELEKETFDNVIPSGAKNGGVF